MITEPLLIFVQQTSPRVEFIFSTLLNAFGIHSLKFTTDKEHFLYNIGAKINYSAYRISTNECWIKPVELLFEKNIKPQVIKCFDWKNGKAFFQTNDSDFPFDIFAASFYLLSRYEEYVEHTKDMYGRYAHENSLSFREGFLDQPVINIWMADFEKMIRNKFPELPENTRSFHFLPTYDIDIAWSYQNKGIVRNTAGIIKEMAVGKWQLVKQRMAVLLKKIKDPFGNYQWLDELHKVYNLKPVYFFLLAQSSKKYDKNIPPNNSALRQLIKEHDKHYSVGIHPSWQSGDKHHLLKEEIELLKNITGKKVNKSRQHYIRMALPNTYRLLIDSGITEDFSMGYGSINGFRASYCLPFQWYDLQKETTTPLIIYPFCYMDANSIFEQHNTPEEALNELIKYSRITKAVKGYLITIFHNHLLTHQPAQMAWQRMYTDFLGSLIEAEK